MCRRRGGGGVGGGDGDGDDDEEREEDEVDDGAPAEATRRAGPFGAGQAEPLADEGGDRRREGGETREARRLEVDG